jgi:hypothetical protein
MAECVDCKTTNSVPETLVELTDTWTTGLATTTHHPLFLSWLWNRYPTRDEWMTSCGSFSVILLLELVIGQHRSIHEHDLEIMEGCWSSHNKNRGQSLKNSWTSPDFIVPKITTLYMIRWDYHKHYELVGSYKHDKILQESWQNRLSIRSRCARKEDYCLNMKCFNDQHISMSDCKQAGQLQNCEHFH